MKKDGYLTSRAERGSYGIYYLAQNIFYTFLGTYVITYLLNSGLSETTIAAIMIAPKIWDAVNDPIFGVIVDKLKFKKGRFMPWIRLSVIFIPITTVLFFAMPVKLPQTAKIVWVIVSYVLWDASYTMCDAPIFALTTTMTPNLNERNSIISLGRITGTLGAVIPMLFVPMMYGENGLGLGWFKTALIMCGIGFVLMLPICFTVKERANAEIEESYTVRQLIKCLFSNKFLLIFYVSFFIINCTNCVQALSSVFCQYALGNETVATAMLVAVAGPVLIVAVFMPGIIKRVDKFYVFIGGMIASVIIAPIQYFVGYENIYAFYGLMVLKGIALGCVSVLCFMFTPDCVEYGHYKTGKRNEGMCFSLQTFVSKLNSAVVTSLSMLVVGAMGFDADNVTPKGANALWFAVTIYAVIGAAVALPLLIKGYKLRDKDVKLMALCNQGEITREECEYQLSGLKKYY